MKWFFCLCFIAFFGGLAQGQSQQHPDEIILGEQVPDYLKAVISGGKVTVNGVQKMEEEPEVVPHLKRQWRNYSPKMTLHPEAVIYLGAHIIGRPELDDTCVLPPNTRPFLFGIRGGEAGMGGPTPEQSLIGVLPAK